MNTETDDNLDDNLELVLEIESITENPKIKMNPKYRQYITKTALKAKKLSWPMNKIYIWWRFTGHRDIIGPKLVKKLRSLHPDILLEVGKDPIPRPPSSTVVGKSIYFLASETHKGLAPIIEESPSMESSEKSDELIGIEENPILPPPPDDLESSYGGNNNNNDSVVYTFANHAADTAAADRRLFTIEEDDASASRQSTGIEVMSLYTANGTKSIQILDGSTTSTSSSFDEGYSASVKSSFTESSSLAELSQQATDGSDQSPLFFEMLM